MNFFLRECVCLWNNRVLKIGHRNIAPIKIYYTVQCHEFRKKKKKKKKLKLIVSKSILLRNIVWYSRRGIPVPSFRLLRPEARYGETEKKRQKNVYDDDKCV